MPSGTPPLAIKKPTIVRIEIDARNMVRWNDKAMKDRAELDALFQTASQQQPQPEVHIKPQGKAKYEAVAGVLASAQRNGLTKLGIVGSEQFAGY
jgi:biopolymer transport protein ExbD